MAEDSKNADRLNVSEVSWRIITDISNDNYFGLNEIQRSELFSFAMALAVDSVPTQLKNKHQGGLVLDRSIDSNTKANIYGLFISHLEDKENLEPITQLSNVFKLAEEYANTGFQILDDYKQKKSDVDLIPDLIVELDKLYKKNVQ